MSLGISIRVTKYSAAELTSRRSKAAASGSNGRLEMSYVHDMCSSPFCTRFRNLQLTDRRSDLPSNEDSEYNLAHGFSFGPTGDPFTHPCPGE